jgi:hypothetical protein
VYRNELLLKVFFGRNAAPGVTRGHVERCRAMCVAEIATYEAVLQEIDSEHAQHPDAPFWKMTVSYGLHASRARERWAVETLVMLDGMKAKGGGASVRKGGSRGGAIDRGKGTRVQRGVGGRDASV